MNQHIRRSRRPGTWSKIKKRITCSPSKTTNRPSSKTFKTSGSRLFSPQHTEMTKGHGRIETRKIWTSTELVGYLEFPFMAQVFPYRASQNDRTNLRGEKEELEVAFGISSLSNDVSSGRLDRVHVWLRQCRK